jgi:hypothetical protein
LADAEQFRHLSLGHLARLALLLERHFLGEQFVGTRLDLVAVPAICPICLSECDALTFDLHCALALLESCKIRIFTAAGAGMSNGAQSASD